MKNITLNNLQSSLVQKIDTDLNNVDGFQLFNIIKPKKCGYYIYGKSGSGKSTVSNIIFSKASETQKYQDKCLNMHFSDYFIDISRMLSKYNYKSIAEIIGQNFKLVCFDEFFIDSIADAKIIYSLFEQLFKQKIFFVITSNFYPHDLFLGGFNV
jgi:cell division protein ZapE